MSDTLVQELTPEEIEEVVRLIEEAKRLLKSGMAKLEEAKRPLES